MKKIIYIICFVFVVIFFVFYFTENKEEQIISEFINYRADLYTCHNELENLLKAKLNETENSKDLEDILKNVKANVDDEAFERLIKDRFIINTEMLSGKYDEAKIYNIEYNLVSKDENKIVYNVKYKEDLFLNEKQEKSIEYDLRVRLEKKDGKWKIFNIKVN